MNENREDELLNSVARQNATSIFLARQRAEEELVRTREALRKQSEWLRVTLASIGDAVVTTDTEGRVVSLNGVAENLTGWPQQEAQGRPLGEVVRIIHEESRQPVEDPAGRALQEGGGVGVASDTLLLSRDGTETPIDATAAPIRDEEGRVYGVVLVIHDITERKRVEEAQARLAAIVESSQDAIVSKTLQGRIVSWNAGAERLFGYTAQEAIGQFVTLLIPSERHDEERLILARLSRGERIEHYETVRVTKQGRRIDVSLTISPMRDSSGRLMGASKIARDITARKQAEEALRQSEAQFRQLADALPQIVWTARPDGFVDYYNERWYEFTGFQREDHGDQSWKPILHPDDVQRTVDTYYGCIRSGSLYQIEYRFKDRKTGGYRWFLGRAYPVRDGQGRIVHWFGTCTDIDETKQADHRKDEFLAMLAHELRNPLAPIRNAVQIFRAKGPAVPELQWATELIARQIHQMTRLVDDLLDVSRITRGKIELRKERVELAAVVNSAVDAGRPLVEKWGHKLTVTIPPEPIYLEADLTRLEQVLLNLLNNAAKYTDQGGRIWVTAERQGDQVEIRIKDTGIGIAPEMLGSIFDMFSQVESSLERSQGGLGIGLTLVRRLVEMHGGKVEAHSAGPGKGSEFVVRLPAAREVQDPASQGGSGRTDDVAPATRRILVVDDNRDAADSLAMLLRMVGNEVYAAHDGLEAVGAAATFQPDVVLLDIGLPKLTGYQVARRLREQPGGADLLLIALTGWGQEEDRRRSREAGFDHHMTKPVEFPALQKLLAAWRPADPPQ